MEPQSQGSEKELFVKMAVSAWETQNVRLNKMLDSISDEALLNETAPGRNTGIYLLGHSTAVNDGLFPLLGFGERLYPHLDEVFLKNPDKSGFNMPSVADLKDHWNTVNSKLMDHISNTSADEWFKRHNSVSEEDFIKEPHRNKLNILISRAIHQSYHMGQIAYLGQKS